MESSEYCSIHLQNHQVRTLLAWRDEQTEVVPHQSHSPQNAGEKEYHNITDYGHSWTAIMTAYNNMYKHLIIMTCYTITHVTYNKPGKQYWLYCGLVWNNQLYEHDQLY